MKWKEDCPACEKISLELLISDWEPRVTAAKLRLNDMEHAALHNSGTKEKPMENQHQHIKGYRDLTSEEIDLINRIKEAGAALVSLQAEVVFKLSTDREIKTHDAREPNRLAPGDEFSPARVELRRFQLAEPERWAAIAKTDIQTGVMALVRAVAQPAV